MSESKKSAIYRAYYFVKEVTFLLNDTNATFQFQFLKRCMVLVDFPFVRMLFLEKFGYKNFWFTLLLKTSAHG